ncbi:MAG TPA: hypothetical protein VKR22_02065 [Acidimicrobiales bacterium]|nr:hypothetical protein [Acidimicrobiales bacterium]
MTAESSPADDVQAWRERIAAFEEAVREEQFPELDLLDMMGAKGRSPDSPTNIGLCDEALNAGVTPNSAAVAHGHSQSGHGDDREHFPAIIEEMEGHEGHVNLLEGLIQQLASRIAPEAVAPLGKAVHELREPIRTVAIACLYTGYVSKEEAAQGFGVPLELIEWLCDVALDSLAAHFRIE